jgi:hypothetical protein
MILLLKFLGSSLDKMNFYHMKGTVDQVWWYIPIILALSRLRHYEFKTSLG